MKLEFIFIFLDEESRKDLGRSETRMTDMMNESSVRSNLIKWT